MQKCSPNATGIALGGIWALSVLFIGITAMYGWGTGLIAPLSTLYIGYSASIGGAIVGAIWALIDGYIGGFIFALIYNLAVK